MRYINIENENPPEDWCRRAEELTRQLMELDSEEERKRLIKNNRIWSDRNFKNWLQNLSHNKCWYSEASAIYSTYDVDHFRPKFRAKQCDGTEREGYWWLAFDWKNYRISGDIGNRTHSDEESEIRGKSDYFPLKEGCSPATPSSDLCDEIIYLLDPTNPVDPSLLTFDETGYPQPAVTDKDAFEFKRAKVTIKLLHLDFRPLVDERKKIWTKCNLLLSRAQKLMNQPPSAIRWNFLETIFNELREMTSEDADLSSTARAFLLSSGVTWAKSLV